MVRALRSFNDPFPLTIEELSLVTNGSMQNPSHILSSLTSLLRLMSVQCLDLTKCKLDSLTLTALLSFQKPKTIRFVISSVIRFMFCKKNVKVLFCLCVFRFSKETLQQLVSVVYEAQDDELTSSFLKKVSKDVTSCLLTWEVIDYLLHFQNLNFKLDCRKSKTTCGKRQLLLWLGIVQLER